MKFKDVSPGKCHLPRYDWYNDPKHYTENDSIPVGRCYHCGSRYNNPSPFSAFCRDCWADLNMSSEEPKKGFWDMINSRTRLSDETPVGNFQRADGNNL